MSRAVLGPLLNTTPFVGRLVLFGDDVAVPAKDQTEAEDVLHTLRSRYESCPTGSLIIGRQQVEDIRSKRVYFGQYGIKRWPTFLGGGVDITPAYNSFERSKDKVFDIACTGDADTIEARVSDYLCT